MNINRYRGQWEGRNRCVEFGGIVYAVATAKGEDIQNQTRNSLSYLDESLAKAGSSKSRILQAQIYLNDINQKAEMDLIWSEWIGPDWHNWPQRACVGVSLPSKILIEIVLTAAKA